MVNFHIIFCPRYRRKIFNIPGVEQRFKELVRQICEAKDIVILSMECHIDHIHLFLNVPPDYSAADIVAYIKRPTGKVLREEFPDLRCVRALWTRSYFASTAGNVSSAVIQQYIANQKTRG